MSRAAAAMLAVGLVAACPAAGWASGFEVRIGGFAPRAQSDLFSDDAELYTPESRSRDCTETSCPGVAKRDWRGLYGGAEFSFDLDRGRHAELALSVDGYSRRIPTSYRNSVRDDGSEIRQDLRLTIVPVGVSLRLLPADRYAPLQPYVTVGGDVFFYKYEERGDFIDFFDDTRPISPDSFRSQGAIFGGHAAAGLRIPVGDDFAITGEVRYQFAEKKRMNDDFDLNRIDVNGASATVGLRLRF
jgi:opacity protein-like surface antigen